MLFIFSSASAIICDKDSIWEVSHVNTREKILTIRLFEKIAQNPEYAKLTGIKISADKNCGNIRSFIYNEKGDKET